MGDLRHIIAMNVIQGREARGWTQQRLADESGVSRPYISEIEREVTAATSDVQEKLAAALSMTVAQLNTEGGVLRLSELSERLSPEAARFVRLQKNDPILKLALKMEANDLSAEELQFIENLIDTMRARMSK